MGSAMEVAQHFIYLASCEPKYCREQLTHLKLQKLLYYAQGWYLVFFRKPLFNETIRAWKHGPVIAQVGAFFKKYKATAIPLEEGRQGRGFSDNEKDLLRWVWDHYKQFSALVLADMTHNEAPWKDNVRLEADGKSSTEIPNAAIMDFFKMEYRRICPKGAELEALLQAERDLQTGKSISLEDLLADTQ